MSTPQLRASVLVTFTMIRREKAAPMSNRTRCRPVVLGQVSPPGSTQESPLSMLYSTTAAMLHLVP